MDGAGFGMGHGMRVRHREAFRREENMLM